MRKNLITKKKEIEEYDQNDENNFSCQWVKSSSSDWLNHENQILDLVNKKHLQIAIYGDR